MSQASVDNNVQPSFAALNLPDLIQQQIAAMGFETPTPIQMQSIPALLEGRDVLGEAQTGTGKTAAFGLPALARIDVEKRMPQLLVVAPTRELAIQVSEAIADFATRIKGLRVATIYGGQSYGPQFDALRRGPQVVVGTPGRLMDHLKRKSLDLSALTTCALDEADEMLNMGFLEDIEWILEHVPSETQMALFSATMPAGIRKVAQRFLKNPVHVKVKPEQRAKANIEQKVWKVAGMNKLEGLERLAETLDYEAMLVFVRTRADTLVLTEKLEAAGFSAAALNGEMSQVHRERTVGQLRSGRVRILIATDVVARGLDVPEISHVINFDLPMDSESYVHRIGRTGRAGREGTAIMFARPREMHNLRRYEKATAGKITSMEMPNAKQLGEIRIARCKQQLAELTEKHAAHPEIDTLRELVNTLAEESGISVLDIAASLIAEKQGGRLLSPKEPVRERRSKSRDDRREFSRDRNERNDRGERRANNRDRGERGDRERRPAKRSNPRATNVDWEQFRLEVGRNHGARPGDIVGAIANEIELDSAFIGEIRMQDEFSFVQLPQGMPKATFNQLKRVRVRNRQMEITRVN